MSHDDFRTGRTPRNNLETHQINHRVSESYYSLPNTGSHPWRIVRDAFQPIITTPCVR